MEKIAVQAAFLACASKFPLAQEFVEAKLALGLHGFLGINRVFYRSPPNGGAAGTKIKAKRIELTVTASDNKLFWPPLCVPCCSPPTFTRKAVGSSAVCAEHDRLPRYYSMIDVLTACS
jgi:hypothetical protein